MRMQHGTGAAVDRTNRRTAPRPWRASPLLAASVAVALQLGACTPSAAAPPASAGQSNGRSDLATAVSTTPGTGSPSSAVSTRRVASRPTKLLVVVLENHAAPQIPRRMPYLSSLAARYGQATRYFALAHPSLPNYLAIAGGTTFGVRDDRGPSAHRLRGASVFGEVLANHRSAMTYAEGMRTPCQRRDTGRYAVRHNPWTYFPGERAACRRDDVPAGSTSRGRLRTDALRGRLPTFALLVPDVCHDAHDCSLRTADGWLRSWLRVIQAGPDWRAGRLAVVVTFDEDDSTAANHVATVVLHPTLHGSRVRSRLDPRDLSAAVSRIAHGAPLRGASRRRGLLAAFHLA
jgi:phosphatidylinositol-3-phosphatase